MSYEIRNTKTRVTLNGESIVVPSTTIRNSRGNKQTFVNLTPHDFNVVGPIETISFGPSGIVARVSPTVTPSEVDKESGIGTLLGYHTVEFGEVINLPELRFQQVSYIVSGMVFDATARPDVVAPGELVRNEAGQPIGCRGFRIKPL